MDNQLEFGIYQQCREFLDFAKNHAAVSDKELAERFADVVAHRIRTRQPRICYPSKYDFKRNFTEGGAKQKNHGRS